MLKVDKMIGPSFQQMWFVVQGMRNPKNSWDKSDSYVMGDIAGDLDMYDVYDFVLGDKDLELMQKLIKAGPEHRKFLRQMWLGLRITAPLYWWKEFDTYKIGTTSNSCSTMHTLMDKPFTMDMFSIEMLDKAMQDRFWSIVNLLEVLRKTYKEGGTLNDIRYEPKSEEVWYMIIQMLPSSFNQTRNVTMNYETVWNILCQRGNHKLSNEWGKLWIELSNAPYSRIFEQFITPSKGEE